MNLLLTIFFFILINNLLGLVPFFPGAYNLTGNISVTLTLSLIILIVINFSGNKYYWKHILAPDIPVWLYPIMVPVEIIGIFSKPIALMIRLFCKHYCGPHCGTKLNITDLYIEDGLGGICIGTICGIYGCAGAVGRIFTGLYFLLCYRHYL